MIRKFWSFLRADEIQQCREEVNKENRLALQMLVWTGLPLSLVNIGAQWIASHSLLLCMRSGFLMLFFLLMLVLERALLERRNEYATAVVYLSEAPVMLVGILLGTVWDPVNQAVTVLLLLLAMPVFIFDRPIRVIGVTLGWTLMFMVLAAFTKQNDVLRKDLVHAVEFFMASAMVTMVVIRVRLESLRSLMRTKRLLEYDEQTGARSRYALMNDAGRYLGRPLVMLVADLDQLTLYSDFYGREVSDEMIARLVAGLVGSFGQEHVFRSSGDEILCISADLNEAECLDIVEACRNELTREPYMGHKIHATCSVGYTTGVPEEPSDFLGMIQLATIYIHKAQKQGRSRTIGSPFDQNRLHDSIVESNTTTNAQDYETNHLTSLPSMSYFIDRCDDLLDSVVDTDRQPMLGYFNLLRVRVFNNEFGYEQGDALIRHTADLLRIAFPQRNLGHITGGEFTVLCYAEEIESAMNQISAALREYRRGFPVECKAGFAAYTGAESAISLLDRARAAHDSIYHDASRCFRIYDMGLETQNRFRQYITGHLDEALEKGYVKIYLQPIVRGLTGQICNEEALSRWDDPEYGFLMPGQFIPVLEENRLLYKLTLYVVRHVAKYLRRRQEKGMTPLPVSVNLSRYDFEDCDIVAAINEIIESEGVEKWLLKLEITETSFIENQALLQREIERFHQHGFQVWMDDFGSGYSALNLLDSLNFDTIKLDMQFVRNLSDSPRNQIIVRDIIDMAKQMDIMTLAEGVEQEEQYRILQEMGCEKLQGFLFSKPVPMESVFTQYEAGTGLSYESGDDGIYYEEVLRFELNAPLQSQDPDTPFFLDNEQPVGVLELIGGRLNCIRATDRFMRLLEITGLLPEHREDSFRQPLVDTPPAELMEAVRRCVETDRWITASMEQHTNRKTTVYLRRIVSHSETGAVALLAAVLPYR